MGITGLLKVFASIQTDRHLQDYQHQSIGIDTYCWIHKAIYLKAHVLMSRLDLSVFIPPILSQIETLLSYKIKPVMVFDGGKLLSKAVEESSREETRNMKQQRARELLLAGDKDAAYRKFAESVDVTPDMALLLYKVIRARFDIECIISPYEADAQLAYLCRIGYIDAVITEDSDLLCFAANKVLYKLNNKGFCKEIELKRWKECTEFSFKDWNFEQFLSLCILSGCDYLPSLKKIGFKTAYKCLNEARSVENLFKWWKMDNRFGFSEDYQKGFYKAFLTFKFQRVFCPVKRRMATVNEMNLEEIETKLKEAGNVNSLVKLIGGFENLSPVLASKLRQFMESDPGLEFLGREIDQRTVCEIADGRINPITLKPYQEEKLHLKGFSQKEEVEEEIRENTIISIDINKCFSCKNLQKPSKDKSDIRKSVSFFGQNPFVENIIRKKAQENASRLKPFVDDNGVIDQITNSGQSQKPNVAMIPSPNNIFLKKPFQQNILRYYKSNKKKMETNENVKIEEHSDFSLHSKNRRKTALKEEKPKIQCETTALKIEEKTIITSFKIEEKPKINGEIPNIHEKKPKINEQKQEIKQEKPEIKGKKPEIKSVTPLKTEERPKLQSVRLKTPEMIDKYKLKQFLEKPNPLKRQSYLDEDKENNKENTSNLEPQRQKLKEDFLFKVWDIQKVKVEQIVIEDIEREFKKKEREFKEEKTLNSGFFNICSQLFKPMFN